MAGSSGDLDIKITGDASEVTAAMTETRSQLDQTTGVIQSHGQAWAAFSAVTHGAITGIGEAVGYQLTSKLLSASKASDDFGKNASKGVAMLSPAFQAGASAASIHSAAISSAIKGAESATSSYSTRVVQQVAATVPAFTQATPAATKYSSAIQSAMSAATQAIANSKTSLVGLFTSLAPAATLASSRVASFSASAVPSFASAGTAAVEYGATASAGVAAITPAIANVTASIAGHASAIAPSLASASASFATYSAAAIANLAALSPRLAMAAASAIAYGQSLLPALSVATTAFIRLAATTAATTVTMLPSLLTISASFASMSASVVAATAGVAPGLLAAGASVIAFASSIASSLVSGIGIATAAIASLATPWVAVVATVGLAAATYKAFTSEISQESYRAAKGTADVTKAVNDLKESFSGLGAALASPFSSAASGTVSLAESFNPFPYIFGKLAAGFVSVSSQASISMKSMEGSAWKVGDALTALMFLTSSHGAASVADAQAFYNEAGALRAAAKAAEERIATGQKQRPLFQQLGEAQEAATQAAKRNEEAFRIGSLNTVEAIDAEIKALRAKAEQAIRTGDAVKNAENAAKLTTTANELKTKAESPKASASDKQAYAQAKAAADAANKPIEDELKQRQRLLDSLEERKSGLQSGRIKPPESSIDAAIASSRMELLKLTEGEDAAAIAAARLAAKTDDERAKVEASIPAFLAAREAVRDVSKAKEEQKQIADLLRKSTEEEAATQKRAADQIASLADKHDLLTGAATKAEIALRELSRVNISGEPAKQIVALTDANEKLAQQKTATDKVNSLRDQIDLLSGAANEAQIAMRELGRAGFTDDQIAEIAALTGQLDALKKLKESQKEEKKEKGDDQPKVALQGSKEAAEIMLRGVGGGSRVEQLGEKQLTAQQKMVDLLSKLPANHPALPQRVPEQPKPQPVPVAVQAQPQPAISSRPIPIQSPIVARSVSQTPVAAQIPTPQVVEPQPQPEPQPEPQPQPQPQPVVQQKTYAEKLAAAKAKQDQLDEAATQARWNVPVWKTFTGMLGGALLGHPIDGARNADSQDSAVEKAEAAAESHLNNWTRKQGEYAPPQESQLAAQPTQVPSALPSSGPVEPAVRPVGVSKAIPSAPEVPNFTIADVPVTKPLPDAPRNVQQQAIATPQPAPPAMPNWEQHAFDVQQSLVSGLSDGPRLSAADDNVPINQAAFPETSFKPNVKPIDVSTPDVAAIDIPSPVVNVPKQSQIAIPSPIVSSPTVPPINVPSPMVNVGTPPSVSVASPTVPPVSIPAPSVTAANPQPISIPTPQINASRVPDVSIPSPSVNLANTPPINMSPPEVSIAPLPLLSLPKPNWPAIPVAREQHFADIRAQKRDRQEFFEKTKTEKEQRRIDVINVGREKRGLDPLPQIQKFELPAIPKPSPSLLTADLSLPTPKMPSLSIPELPRAKPPSLEKFSGMSTRVEASLRSGPSNEASNLRNLEKLAASQLLELKNNTAAVKANKPQQLAAGSV